jgi:hypothetical protein
MLDIETPLTDAVLALERSEILRAALQPMLFKAFVSVRRADSEALAQEAPEAIAAIHRWRY